jgi:hypothetical protein
MSVPRAGKPRGASVGSIDAPASEPETPSGVAPTTGGVKMEQQQDREARIGIGLVAGLALFALVALVSFYFQKPVPDLAASIRHNIVSTPR